MNEGIGEIEGDRRAAHRLVMDNLPVFLWIGFLQPVALGVWARGTGIVGAAAVLGGLAFGFLLVVLGLRAEPAEAARGASRIERRATLAVNLALFGLAAHLGLVYLIQVLLDLGWPAERLGYTGLEPESPWVFLFFVAFWSFFLALLAERLAPWVRELLKIERHVLVGFAVGLVGLHLLGRVPSVRLAPVAGGWTAMAAFGFAFVVVLSQSVDSWREGIASSVVRMRAAAILWLVAPAVLIGIVALLGMDLGGTVLRMETEAPDTARFSISTLILVPNGWLRALLDLAFCLGSIGICAYLGYHLVRELPISFGWRERAVASLVPVGVAGVLRVIDAYDDVPRLFLVLACVVGPLRSAQGAPRRGRFVLAGCGAIGAGLVWLMTAADPLLGERGRVMAPLVPVGLVLAAGLLGVRRRGGGRWVVRDGSD